MKKHLPVIFGFTFFFILTSCSNLFSVKEDTDSEAAGDGLVISLGNSNTRMISAVSQYSTDNVISWIVTLTDTENEDDYTYTSSAGTVTVSDNALTIKSIPEGTYSLLLEGYTSENYVLYGKASSVTVSSSSAGKASVLLGLKKEDTGSLKLTLGMSSSLGGEIGDFTPVSFFGGFVTKVTLTSIEDSSLYYSFTNPSPQSSRTDSSSDDETDDTEDSDTDTEDTSEAFEDYTFSSSDTDTSGIVTGSLSCDSDAGTVTLTAENIKSGFYKLTFEGNIGASYAEMQIFADNNLDTIVEIADGVTTESALSIYAVIEKNYYATTGESSLNGLSSSSRVNINTLLERLTGKLPDIYQIIIYMDEAPEWNLDVLVPFLEKCKEERRYVEILLEEASSGDSSSRLIEIQQTSSTGTGIAVAFDSKPVILTAGSKYTTIDVADEVEFYYDVGSITLKNGASVKKVSNMNPCLLYLVDSTGKADNFDAYASGDTPFMVSKAGTNDFATDLSLCEYGSTDASNTYTVGKTSTTSIETVKDDKDRESTEEVTTYSYYVTKAGSSSSNIITSENVTITATEAAGDPVSGSELEYDVEYTYSLSCSSDESVLSNITSYTWSLNGTTLSKDASSSTVSFALNTQDGITITGSTVTAVIACVYVCNRQTYIATAEFTAAVSTDTDSSATTGTTTDTSTDTSSGS